MSGWKARIPDYHGDEWISTKKGWAGTAYNLACDMARDYCKDAPEVVADSESVEVEVMSPVGEVTRWTVHWRHRLSFDARLETDDQANRSQGGES